MNEDKVGIEAVLEDALIGMIDTATDAKDFLASEIPEVIGQLLMWHAAESVIFMISGVAAVYASWRVFVKARPAYQEASNGYDIWHIFAQIGHVVVGFFGILAFVLHLSRFAQILIAPKLYLIEYAAQIIR